MVPSIAVTPASGKVQFDSRLPFYAWKSKFGGMSVPDARRLKQLEEENARLKKLLAEAMLDNAVLKDITARKW